jgi:TatD DNase family protein
VTTLIDTHAHLDDEQLHADLPDVIARAHAVGVREIVAVGINAASSQRCVALTNQYLGLHATVGIHPNEIRQAGLSDWHRVRELATRPGVVGIGETGLDRYWDKTPFEIQQEWFARHLGLGRELKRAVVIHCRDAEADVIQMLRHEFNEYGPIRAVMHSFTGTPETAQACLAMGLHISFAGMLTYKNAGNLREVAKEIPLDRLLVETDCPYLAPVPMRGKRNEPAHVVHTATCLAGVIGQSVQELAEITTTNARGLFGISDIGMSN